MVLLICSVIEFICLQINCVFLAITLKVLWENQRKVMSDKVSANAEVAKYVCSYIAMLLILYC